jgi:hypothetical protein
MSAYSAVENISIELVFPDCMLVVKDNWYQVMIGEQLYPLRNDKKEKCGEPVYCFGVFYWAEDGKLCSFDVAATKPMKHGCAVPWINDSVIEFMRCGDNVLAKTNTTSGCNYYYRTEIGVWGLVFVNDFDIPVVWRDNTLLTSKHTRYGIEWVARDKKTFAALASGVIAPVAGLPITMQTPRFLEVSNGFVVDDKLYTLKVQQKAVACDDCKTPLTSAGDCPYCD